MRGSNERERHNIYKYVYIDGRKMRRYGPVKGVLHVTTKVQAIVDVFVSSAVH